MAKVELFKFIANLSGFRLIVTLLYLSSKSSKGIVLLMKTEYGKMHTEMCITKSADRPSARNVPRIKITRKTITYCVSHTSVIGLLLNINVTNSQKVKNIIE